MNIDAQMLKFIEVLKANGILKFDIEYCNTIGIHKQNFSKIKSGERSFTIDMISKTIQAYELNPCWLFGLESEPFKKPKNMTVNIN